MEKAEFERRIKKMGLEKITNSSLEQIIMRSTYFTERKRDNFYGMYKRKKKYIIFYKDPERGVVTEIGEFDTEEEAYDALITSFKKSEYII